MLKKYFDEDKYDELKSSDNVLYFHFKDLSDYFSIPFYVFRDPIEGYVKVEIEETENMIMYYTYYISLTDGTYGFPETKFEDLKRTSVVPYTILQIDNDNNNCYFSVGA